MSSKVPHLLSRAVGRGKMEAWSPSPTRLVPRLLDAVPRLSPDVHRHLNLHGHYAFRLPELVGRRALRDPESAEEEAE